MTNSLEWMFFDVAKIHVKAGDGGNGCNAMRREFRVDKGGMCIVLLVICFSNSMLAGPSGGNGGNGGSIYLVCDRSLNTLGPLRSKIHYTAESGLNGKGDSRHGRKGTDIHIYVPPGSIIRDENGVLAGELNTHGQQMLVARGGRGGRGNEHFKTPRNSAPEFCEIGELGSKRWLNVELRLLADVGFVGVPNAGKSTLLAACTKATPKIADYPFTTIVPNLGVCDVKGTQDRDGKGLILADIPGLLEGAHDGIGLGIAFLRHVQRCRIILHMIKGTSVDPINDYLAINQELELFNPKLANKTQVIVINHLDVPHVRASYSQLKANLSKICNHNRIIGISAVTSENVPELMKRLRYLLDSILTTELHTQELFSEEAVRVEFDSLEEAKNESFEVVLKMVPDPSDETCQRLKPEYHVIGRHIERVGGLGLVCQRCLLMFVCD